MKSNLSGNVALVTGASGIVGQAICSTLADCGALVVATDLSGRLRDGEQDNWLELDVTDSGNWSSVIEQVERRHGRLDILVNNAGIARLCKLSDMTFDEWKLVQSINVDGAFLGMKHSLDLLRKSGADRAGGSAIVNIASGASYRAIAFEAAYNTSKAALWMLTKAAAVEFATLSYPVRVNSVHPGAVRSEMIDALKNRWSEVTGRSTAEWMQAMMAAQPMGRFVEPSEVADAVAFLASGQASFVHGASLDVDGGFAAA